MNAIETDVLIVGGGAAGLITALNARGRRVCVLCPDDADAPTTASDYAQGGIAAAVGPGDTPALHIADTLFAGHQQNFIPAARFVCREAPSAITYLQSLGVQFAREECGWSLHAEAAHSRKRVLNIAGDATGAAIMFTLRRRIAEATHVEVLPSTRAVSLLCDAESVRGVAAMTPGGRTLAIRARTVVIATGGIGGLYSHTTNPTGACGDGIAMALAAGARCEALEFVQFHPTALDVDTRPLPLLTEALRGAGARLVDEDGASIMYAAHPLGDLAPRDEVARAIYLAQITGRQVFLDATRMDVDVRSAFPAAHKACQLHGMDLARMPVPITPAAHYYMGGIAVDLDGRTSLPALWAVGEAAYTGMHGANRLASNSLLEAVVLGRRVGRVLSCEPYSRPMRQLPAIAEFSELPEQSCERELAEVMWRCMGVVRNRHGLAAGLGFLARLRDATSSRIGLRPARLLLAERMMLAAARRRANCGAHYRSDADEMDLDSAAWGEAAHLRAAGPRLAAKHPACSLDRVWPRACDDLQNLTLVDRSS
jgi:L-aspartate oxidase